MTAADTRIQYRVSVPEPETHLVRVRLTLPPSEMPQYLALPAWIPGSYMIRDFARNIVEITARLDGRPLDLGRVDKQTWCLDPVAAGGVEVDYLIYAHDLSVRGAHVDDTHVYFNGPGIFLRAQGLEALRHEVIIEKPSSAVAEDWRVATTMPSVDVDDRGFGRYRSRNYGEFIDYPVEISAGAEVGFVVDGVPHGIVVTGRQDADLELIATDVAKICRAHGEMFGLPLPVERYLFLVTVVDDGYGGLEHRDSTSLMCSRGDLSTGDDGDSEGYRRFLGLCSHEYFHLWNVKRIRPARFAESDLSAEAYSDMLWAFEGFTSYYDDLALVRSGVIPADAYLELLAQNVTRLMRNGGRLRQSVAESSFYAWTKFYKQDENAPNAIVSYYTKGALVAFGLDIALRVQSGGAVSLDDVMRALWNSYGRSETGVPEGAIERLVAEIAGRDMGGFFAAYVHGADELPLAEWLGKVGVGMRLQPARDLKDKGGVGDPHSRPPSAKPVLGGAFSGEPGGARLTQVFDGGAAQAAGLSPGDLVIAVDGLRVQVDTLAAHIARRPAGEHRQVHAFRRDELRVFQVYPKPAPDDTCYLWWLPDTSMDAGAGLRRNAWLGRMKNPE